MTVDRAWIGISDGEPVFRISKAGINVRTAATKDLLFDWQMKSLQKTASGVYDRVVGKNDSATTMSISIPDIGGNVIVLVLARRVDQSGFTWVDKIAGNNVLQSQSSSSITVYVPFGNGVASNTWRYAWFVMSVELL